MARQGDEYYGDVGRNSTAELVDTEFEAVWRLIGDEAKSAISKQGAKYWFRDGFAAGIKFSIDLIDEKSK